MMSHGKRVHKLTLVILTEDRQDAMQAAILLDVLLSNRGVMAEEATQLIALLRKCRANLQSSKVEDL